MNRKIKFLAAIALTVVMAVVARMMMATSGGLCASYERSAKLPRVWIEQGNTEALYREASMGLLFGQNIGKEAVKCVRKAADQGHSGAQTALGNAYHQGAGIKKDEKEAAHWWRKAAEQGDAQAKGFLTTAYQNVINIGEDDKDGTWDSVWRKAAERGDAQAQLNLGNAYKTGWGVKESDIEAVKWWRKAAEQGNAQAQFHLGETYNRTRIFRNAGVARDMEEAVKWFSKAAEQSHETAQYYLNSIRKGGVDAEEPREAHRALMQYENTRHQDGNEKDNKEAVILWRKAAEQGDADAQFKLGYAYHRGEGVEKDDKEAIIWWRKSAEQGNNYAQRYLGDAYHLGWGDNWGSPDDHRKAVIWWRKAAEQGNVDAQFNLKNTYRREDDSVKDEKKIGN